MLGTDFVISRKCDISSSQQKNRLLWKSKQKKISETMACCLASCCASATCGLCSSVASGISRKSARIAYCGLFGASLVVSWILRETGAPLLEKLPCTILSSFSELGLW